MIFFALVETWHKGNNLHDFSVNGYITCNVHHSAKEPKEVPEEYIKEQLTGEIEKIKDANLTMAEDRVWFRMYKLFLGVENDLYLGIWYIPSFESCRYTQHQDMWENLEWTFKGRVMLF